MRKKRNLSCSEALAKCKWGIYAVIAVWSLMFACYSISATVRTIDQYLDVEASHDSVWVWATPKRGGIPVPINLAQDNDTLYGDTSGTYHLYLDDSTDYNTHAIFFSGGAMSGSSNGFVDLQDTTEIKTLATNNPSIFYGPTSSGAGPDTLWYYTTDTGNDTRVQGVQIGVYTLGGVLAAYPLTNASGYGLMTLTQADTFIIISYGPPRYVWATDTILGFTPGSTDSTIGYKIGDPDPAAGPDYITAYLDISTGAFSGGSMVPHVNIIGKLHLLGAPFFAGGTWAIIPTVYPDTADSNGRLTWQIPVNTSLTPAGSYYELYLETRSGRPLTYLRAKRFSTDTTADPLNILDATEVR